MKRSAPLKRTSFARPMRGVTFNEEARPGSAFVRATVLPLRAGVYSSSAGAGQPKRDYVRSRQLLENVHQLMYCHLGRHHAMVCACHSNWAVHGKGKGIKADDNRIAAGCLECHHELDQGTEYSEPEKQRWWWVAHVATVRAMLNAGLWPAGVPVPDTAESPFEVSTS